MIFSLQSFLSIGAVLFALGFYITLTRKNMIAVLMGAELILNGAALNFVAFDTFNGIGDGQIMTLFIIALAALEAVVALAIILTIYKKYGTVSVDRVSSMQD
jgi:NADH-quinone oxidoreductase subunit K